MHWIRSTYDIHDMQRAMRALVRLGSETERGYESFQFDWQLQTLTNIDSLKYHMLDLQKAMAEPTVRNLGDVSRAITMDVTRMISAINLRGDGKSLIHNSIDPKLMFVADLPLPGDFDEAVKKVAESLSKLVETNGGKYCGNIRYLIAILTHYLI